MKVRGRVLIIRFSSIGDVLLTTPVVRALAAAGWEVHFVTKSTYAPLLRYNPYIRKLHLFEASKPLVHFARCLHNYRFHWIVDLHKNLRSLILRGLLRRPTVSYDKAVLRRWWITNVDRHGAVAHVVHRYLRAVHPLGAQWDGQGLDFFFPPGYCLPKGLLPPGWEAGGYGVVVVGAAHFTKRIPPEKVLEYLREIRGKAVLIGGVDAMDAADRIRKAYPLALDLTGKTDLYASAALLRAAMWVLTPDTGMMHLAAALRRPIVSVWGGTSPRLGMAPFLGYPPPRTVEHPSLSCHPCHRHGLPDCPKGHFRCMLELDLGAEGRRIRIQYQ